MVIVIIGVLAGITLSVSAGVRARAARDRAAGELAVLSVGLEDYRRVLGEYPQGEDATGLLAALAGQARPNGEALNRRPFVAFEALTLADPDPTLAGNVLLDPWEQPYVYRSFRQGARSGYRLYSIGPDGLDVPPSATGALDEDAAPNRDNVYAHR